MRIYEVTILFCHALLSVLAVVQRDLRGRNPKIERINPRPPGPTERASVDDKLLNAQNPQSADSLVVSGKTEIAGR